MIKTYKNIVAYCGRNYTLLPLALHVNNKIDEVFAFNQPLEKDEIVRQDNIANLDVFNLYSIPKTLLATLKEQYPQAVICHQASVFIEKSLEKQDIEKQLFIEVYSGFFYANITQNGKLLFSNAFEYANTEEFIYFVLNIFDKFGLNQLETKLHISGEINKKDKKAGILKDYIKYIEICVSSAENSRAGA